MVTVIFRLRVEAPVTSERVINYAGQVKARLSYNDKKRFFFIIVADATEKLFSRSYSANKFQCHQIMESLKCSR